MISIGCIIYEYILVLLLHFAWNFTVNHQDECKLLSCQIISGGALMAVEVPAGAGPAHQGEAGSGCAGVFDLLLWSIFSYILA